MRVLDMTICHPAASNQSGGALAFRRQWQLEKVRVTAAFELRLLHRDLESPNPVSCARLPTFLNTIGACLPRS